MVKKAIAIGLFLLITVLYINNLTRDIYAGDAGDLVTAGYLLGVAHPPGYPLFSLLGYFFSHLPLPLPVVSRVGLISVVASLLALIVFLRYCMFITNSLFIAVLTTAVMAFSYLFWLMAELPEGLALNNLFTVLILYLATRFYYTKQPKYQFLLFLMIGLSMTHQFYIATIFPAVFFIII